MFLYSRNHKNVIVSEFFKLIIKVSHSTAGLAVISSTTSCLSASS